MPLAAAAVGPVRAATAAALRADMCVFYYFPQKIKTRIRRQLGTRRLIETSSAQILREREQTGDANGQTPPPTPTPTMGGDMHGCEAAMNVT